MKIKKYRVDSSLEYGVFYRAWLQVVAVIGFLFDVIGIIGVAIVSSIEKRQDMGLGYAFLILILPVFVYLYFISRKQRKEVKKALKDAVVITAQTTITDMRGKAVGTRFNNILTEKQRLAVKFFYNGEKIIKLSAPQNIKRPFIKNKRMFLKYGNRKVQILYSPTENHVLLIKQKEA